jgi:hypothetical protein
MVIKLGPIAGREPADHSVRGPETPPQVASAWPHRRIPPIDGSFHVEFLAEVRHRRKGRYRRPVDI